MNKMLSQVSQLVDKNLANKRYSAKKFLNLH